MSQRHVIVVVRDRPADLALIRGSIEQNRDEATAAPLTSPVPLLGGWGKGMRDGGAPATRLRAWGFWISTEDKDTRAFLLALRDAGVVRLFIGPPSGDVHPTWEVDVGWVRPPLPDAMQVDTAIR